MNLPEPTGADPPRPPGGVLAHPSTTPHVPQPTGTRGSVSSNEYGARALDGREPQRSGVVRRSHHNGTIFRADDDLDSGPLWPPQSSDSHLIDSRVGDPAPV